MDIQLKQVRLVVWATLVLTLTGCSDDDPVAPPVPPPDVTPPDVVSDLGGEPLLDTAVILSWTAPRDDGETGRATTYDIRCSTDPLELLTAGGWKNASRVLSGLVPGARGAREQHAVSITGIAAADECLYFALRSTDAVGNQSPVSNLPVIAVASWRPWTSIYSTSRLAGMAVDVSGTIYVADEGLAAVHVIDRNGTLTTSWAGFAKPFGVARRGAGVYVTDVWSHRVRKYSTNGDLLRSWGGEGTSAGAFRSPAGIAVGGQGIYVVDIQNNRVQVFDEEGRFRFTWGTFGTGEGQFEGPVGIALHPSERPVLVYVVDQNRVQCFDTHGRYVSEWRAGGLGITIDKAGRVFVVDGSRVAAFDANHRALSSTAIGCRGIAIGLDGYPIISNQSQILSCSPTARCR